MPWRGFGGVGAAIDGLHAHPSHQRFDMPAANFQALLAKQIAQHPAAGERIVEMQLVDLAHQPQVCNRDRMRLVVDRAAADVKNLGLLRDGKIMLGVNHLFTLSNPALVSAPSKKSFSRVNWPILACKDFTSTVVVASSAFASPKTPAAPSRSWLFHCVIWLACTSNCSASSESVFSLLSAAKATLALNTAEWFLRGRLLIGSPLLSHLRLRKNRTST